MKYPISTNAAGVVATWARPLPPGAARPGKFEQRVWMVCFWTAFIVALCQLLFASLAIWGLTQSRGLPGSSPTTARFEWWFINPWGWMVDCVVGVIVAPLPIYAFAKARNEGLNRWRVLGMWLAVRGAFAIALLYCGAVLWSEGSWPFNVMFGMIFFRLVIFNLPLYLFLLGLLIVRAQKRRSSTHGIVEEVKTAARPIDPLA